MSGPNPPGRDSGSSDLPGEEPGGQPSGDEPTRDGAGTDNPDTGQTDFYSQRYIACRQDDQVVSRRGWATVVVSTPGQRPSRATRRCGVTWMPWGPVPEGALLLRHMLPADDFEQTVAVAEYRKERRTMKGYLPRSTYYADAEDFDANAALRCR